MLSIYKNRFLITFEFKSLYFNLNICWASNWGLMFTSSKECKEDEEFWYIRVDFNHHFHTRKQSQFGYSKFRVLSERISILSNIQFDTKIPFRYKNYISIPFWYHSEVLKSPISTFQRSSEFKSLSKWILIPFQYEKWISIPISI